MAVAVKTPPETVAPMTLNRLAVVSFTGVVYILGCIWLVFFGIPSAWYSVLGDPPAGWSFIYYAALGVVMIAAAIGLVWLGLRLAGPSLPEGARAGIGLGAIGLPAAFLITVAVGSFLEYLFGAQNAVLWLAVTAAVLIALLFFLARTYLRADAQKRLAAVEEQGWFSLAPYKKSQGQRVRRGTMLGILAIAGCGIWTLVDHKTLEIASKHWNVTLPFTSVSFMVLRDVRFTMPILLSLASLWIAYRIVNFPRFSDFLIATEAELNKVSWATRRRLVQDTIVVLTTVVLVTAFIFFVDIFWGFSLRKVGVLQFTDKPAEESKHQKW